MPDQDVTEATSATVPEESGAAYEANPEAIDPPEPTIEGVEETTSEAADAPEADADARPPRTAPARAPHIGQHEFQEMQADL